MPSSQLHQTTPIFSVMEISIEYRSPTAGMHVSVAKSHPKIQRRDSNIRQAIKPSKSRKVLQSKQESAGTKFNRKMIANLTILVARLTKFSIRSHYLALPINNRRISSRSTSDANQKPLRYDDPGLATSRQNPGSARLVAHISCVAETDTNCALHAKVCSP